MSIRLTEQDGSTVSQDSSHEAYTWLRTLRHETINLLLGSVSILGTVGILINLIRGWASGMGSILFTTVYYFGAYLTVMVLFFARRISDRWRAIGFSALIYVFSLLAFYSGWLGGSGRLFLLLFIVLTTILIGSSAGVIAIMISLVTFAFYGIAYTQGWLVYNLAPAFADPTIVLIEGIGFLMAVGMISISLRFFRQGLSAANASIDETREARALLAEQVQKLDDANQLLTEHRKKLEAANAEFEYQSWFNAGQSMLYAAMREDQELSVLADGVLLQLCRHLNFPIGTLFLAKDDHLVRIGRYALPAGSTAKDRLIMGEGLVGQAGLEQRIISVHEIPADSIMVSSGLGQAPPAGLLIVPLIYNGQLIGVLEFGFLTDSVEKEIDFLQSVSESIAITLNTAQDRIRIDHLLSETQRQAKELQIREEELSAANQELQEQATALHSRE